MKLLLLVIFLLQKLKLLGLFDKDTYKKYPRVLIGHRAFTLGARDIAPDAIMGCCEMTELKLINGKDLSSDDFIDVDSYEIVDEQ